VRWSIIKTAFIPFPRLPLERWDVYLLRGYVFDEGE